MFRSLSVLITAVIQLSCSKMNPLKDFPWSEHGKTLVWRCILGQFVFVVFNFCLKLVPLTFQMIIFQTSTFWISILAYCFLSETMLPLEIISMIISFAAMVVITVTGASNASEIESNPSEEVNYSSVQLIIGYTLVLAVAWTYASANILNRALKDVSTSLIMFWHGALGILIAIVAISIEYFAVDMGTGNGLHIFNMSLKCFGYMFAATLADTLTVNAMTIAFQSDSSGFVSLLTYFNVIYAFVADILIFKESFTWVELLAASTILFVTVLSAVVKLRES